MKKGFVLSITVVVLIVIFLFVQYKFCWSPFTYSDNSKLEYHENREIKRLILLSIKDLFSAVNSNDIYISENSNMIIQLDEKAKTPRSFLVIIDHDFMKNIQKAGDSEYFVIVEVYYPATYFCEINICKIGNGYKIKSFLLDI